MNLLAAWTRLRDKYNEEASWKLLVKESSPQLWSDEKKEDYKNYSGTPLIDHFQAMELTTTSLIRPLYSGPKDSSVSDFPI